VRLSVRKDVKLAPSQSICKVFHALEILCPDLELRWAILAAGETGCSEAMSSRIAGGVIWIDDNCLKILSGVCSECCVEVIGVGVVCGPSNVATGRRGKFIWVHCDFTPGVKVDIGP
jgi:hypothetical protein